MTKVKKTRSNGAVVSVNDRTSGEGVFVSRRSPDGHMITSMNRSVYVSALANAKAALRKKAMAAG